MWSLVWDCSSLSEVKTVKKKKSWGKSEKRKETSRMLHNDNCSFILSLNSLIYPFTSWWSLDLPPSSCHPAPPAFHQQTHKDWLHLRQPLFPDPDSAIHRSSPPSLCSEVLRCCPSAEPFTHRWKWSVWLEAQWWGHQGQSWGVWRVSNKKQNGACTSRKPDNHQGRTRRSFMVQTPTNWLNTVGRHHQCASNLFSPLNSQVFIKKIN